MKNSMRVKSRMDQVSIITIRKIIKEEKEGRKGQKKKEEEVWVRKDAVTLEKTLSEKGGSKSPFGTEWAE